MNTGALGDDQWSVEDIVARIAAGDRTAETALVRRYSPIVMYVLRRRLRNDDAAQDLHQETFIAVLRHLRAGKLETAEALPGFVRQTALNLVTGAERKALRQRTDVDTDAIERAAAGSRDALAELDRLDTVALVRRSIDDLGTPRDRELLKRYFVAQDEKQSICADLGLGQDHFDRVLHRAKQRLAQIVARVFARSGMKS